MAARSTAATMALAGPGSPWRTIEDTLEVVYPRHSAEEMERARKVLSRLSPPEVTLLTRIGDGEKFEEVARSCGMSKEKALETLRQGISKLEEKNGVKALCDLVGRMKELEYLKVRIN